MTLPADDPFAFGEKLLAVLHDGSFVATYKYAVLLGLLDLALEATNASGEAPPSVTTRQLAESVIERYWPQTRDFKVLGAPPRQSTGKTDARILRQIAAFRAAAAAGPTWTLFRARQSPRVNAKDWAQLVDDVEWTLVRQPLHRLQRVGSSEMSFLYTIAWSTTDIDEGRVTRAAFKSGRVSNVISFQVGAGGHLVRLGGLIRPLIQREWAARVAQVNRLPEARLEAFLFGGLERRALDPVRPGLVELQRGRCFYCERSMSADCDVDHFVPWARHPNDAIENLVAAHRGCNGAKSDHLAGGKHIDEWLSRNRGQLAALADVAKNATWESDRALNGSDDASITVARGIYLKLPGGYRLWNEAKQFEPIDHGALSALFA